ncbi:COP1-interacting protein [Trifolium repens]|nr:COP1-interacting protein [Trifolium repens]
METPNSHNANVIFIDTNLDTHFALTVFDHDSVSDLKNRIELEHLSCFPKIGQIQIHGIKVKRNGYFYHLSDSMIVRSAFSGFNKSWFLSVDVSALEDCRQNEKLFSLHQMETIGITNNPLIGSGDNNNNNNAIILPCNYQLQLLENKKDEREGVSVKEAEADVKSSGNNDVTIPLPDSIPKTDDRSHLNNEVQSLHVECEVDDGLGKGNKDDCNVDVEESSISVRSEKRKRKSKRKREDTVDVGGDNSKEEIPSDRMRVSEPDEKEAVNNLENKKDEGEVVSVVKPCVSEHTAKAADGGVKSSGNNDVTTSLPGSIPKTDDRSHLNNEVDGLHKGNKDDCNVGVEEPSMSVQSEKKKRKSKRKREDTVDVGGGDNSKKEIPSDYPRFSEHIEKEAVKNLETVPSLNIECIVDGSGEENKEVPSAKRRKKSKKEKEGTVRGDNSKEEIPSDHPRASEHTEKEATKLSEVVPNLSIECEVDGSGERNKDEGNVGEEVPLVSVPSTKTKKKSKKKKDTVGGDNSKDNITAVNNPVNSPSERATSFNNFQVPQSENKQDEKKEIPFDGPCDSHNTKKEAVKNLDIIPNSHIECEVDGSNKGSKNDSIVCEEGTSKSAPSKKNKQKSKSKRKKEDTVGGDISKDNIASVDNPLGYPSEKASSINNFQVSQSENKQEEKEMPFDLPRVPERTEKSVKNLEMVPNLHIECVVDGSNKGIKGDSIVCEKGTSKPAPSAKKKHKSGRKKEDVRRDDTLKEKDVSVVVPVQHDIVVLANSSENADKEIIKETEVLKEHQNTESNDNNTKNDGNVVSMKEVSELKSPVKKKPKKSKRSLSHNSNEPSKVEAASQKDQAQTADGAHRERKESEDIVLSKTNLDTMEIETNVCKESIQFTTKEAGNYKNQSDIEMEVQASDANGPKDPMKDNQNVVGRCHESEVGQIEGAAEGEVPPQNDHVSGLKQPVKLVKEKKERKKVKNIGGGQTPKKDNGPVDALESETVVAKSLKATVCDPLPENTETQENLLNQTEGKVMQQEEMQGSVLSVTDKGGDFSTDNADSLEQPKTKSNAENVDEHVSKKLKKKPNNKQSSTPKGTSDMLTNGHVFDSKKECDAQKINKAPIAHKTGQVAKLSSQSDSAMSSIGENRKPLGNASVRSMDLEKQRECIPISNRKLEGSNKMVQNKAKKASGNSVTGVVSNSQPKKSLLEGAIFKDDGSSASEDEDENKVDDSDASTRTPSDNSLVSDFDGYDSPGLDSQQNGTYNGKRLENDERSPLKANLSGPTKMSIDLIVRSSTRYKKAKLTASQLDETQPESSDSPEFVPDSLAM